MKTVSRIFFILVLCMTGNLYKVSGEELQYNFKHYDISQGLSQNSVMALHQDSKGFIWIGTKNGLNRFDGTCFRNFLRGEKSGDLQNSMIYSISEDSSGKIWVATDAGIEIYNPFTEKFTHFDAMTGNGNMINGAINKIIVDKKDNAWILSGDNLFRYSIQSDTLIRLNEGLADHTGFRPKTIFKDEIQGLLYIGVPVDGLFAYDPETDRYTHIASCPHTPTDICIYKRHFALMGTINHGVYLINLASGESRRMNIGDKDRNMFVREITEVSETEYWIGTEDGIYILRDGVVEHLEHETFYERSLADNAIYAILVDKDKGIWVGSYFGGINYLPEKQPYFTSITPKPSGNSVSGFRVREFAEDKYGRLWIATEDNGLNLYFPEDREGGVKFRNTNTGDDFIPFNNIQCLDIDGNNLWIGTFSNGIYILDIDTFKTVHYEKSGNPWSLDNNDVFAICTDSDGTTWVGTSSGALTFAPEINGFKKFDKTSGAFVSDIMQDSEGYIWFTTYNRGVFRYDAKKDEILNFRHEPDNRYSLCYDRIISVYEDSAKRLWFGSEDGGFCRYNRIDGTFSSITADDGLPSNVIHSIIEDDDKHLWLSTNNGLVHFDPTGMKIIDIYNQFNGLPSRQFNYNSGYRTEDGTIYFGSINGFVCFNPEFFKTDSSRHSVIFTDFKILGSEDEDIVDSGHISETAIPYTSSVSLDYRHNSFSIGFSALDYSGKGNGKYAYRLEGAEKTWNYISDNIPTITYNRMMPGNYTLKIKYSPDGHTWDDNTSNLGIVIKPPFWKTKWASAGIIILTLLSIGAIIIYIMYRREKSLQDKLALQEQKQSEEIYKAKIDFFTNMAHEIRTPITLIKIPLDSMLKKPDMDKDEIQENLVTMERNANRLLVLVNQLLDFRKIESNAMSLILKKKNINKIVESAMTDFLATAEQKNIDMTLHCPEKPVMAMVDEEALMKICSNLLSNAIKYASSYIKIELSKNTEYDYFSISVHNDGEKIAENMRERIFEAFFQIKSNWQPSQPGSGIGLTLASSLTKLHNGNLFIDEKAEDTAFIVQIPLKTKDIAGENEKADMQEPQSDDVESEETAIHDGKDKKTFTVLIVEDNEELLNLLAQQLEVNYNIFTAANGVEAMKILGAEMINLVISDVMMPLMDGFELCSKIKSTVSTSHIPVILLTAKTNLEDKIAGLETGADAYIGKPFSISYLMAQADSMLKNRAALLKKFADDPLLGTSIMAQSKEDELFLTKLTNLIVSDMTADTLNINQIASEMNMSRSSLHRKIKGCTGMTPGSFILTLRLKKAAELLKTGNYRINEICMIVGINSTSYFTKCFYRQFGVTPKDYISGVSAPKSDD